MATSLELLRFLEDLFSVFGGVDMRRMFGGSGIYRDSVMLGLIASDILYLRAGDGNRAGFERSGMSAFTYRHKNNKGPVTMPYSEVPADILEDPDALAEWSDKGFGGDKGRSTKMGKKRKRKGRTQS